MRNTYTGKITELGPNQIFVFGSNTQGRHGKGAAYTALIQFGAIYGHTRGRQGSSYAIVTKDLTAFKYALYPQSKILNGIVDLYYYADNHRDLEFLVAYSGTGVNLNGYTPLQMAELFAHAAEQEHITIPENITFELGFYSLVRQFYTE